MRIQFFSKMIAVFLCTIYLTCPSAAQPFESTFGSLVNNETPQDGKPIPNGRYMILSNSLSYGPESRILLTRLNSTGSISLNGTTTIHELANPNTAYYGAAIDLDFDAAGVHNGYFIAGSRSTANGRQALLIRTNTSGQPTWVKVLPNNDASGNLDETGVSVERQSNGDVVLTANGYNVVANNYRFSVSRFSSAGGQLWSNRYYATTSGQSFEATEACNAFRSGVATIVVTGRFWTAGSVNPHTFLSCVNASTGVEIWRRSYDSGFTSDAGMDVVYKPANGVTEPAALMAVGRAGLQASTLWVIRAAPLNGLASTKTYAPNVSFSGFAGTAISLDVTGTRAAITGSIVYQPVVGTIVSGTFAMVLPFYGTELPDWTNYYDSSSPQFTDTRGIAPVTGASNGYLVTCGTRLTGSAFNDTHTIRINSDGTNGTNGCDIEPITVVRTLQGEATWRPFNRTPFTWTNILPGRRVELVTQEFCAPGFVSGGDRSEILDSDPLEIRVSPNPTAIGQNATLTVELPELGAVQIRVYDLAGRAVWTFDQVLESDTKSLELPTSEWTNGIYFLHVQTSNLQKSIKLVVSGH